VLTARHHDGYCLWDSRLTDYTSAAQAPRRDFVREYVKACRAEGLRVGLYYSLADWRIPAYWQGPAEDPIGWDRFVTYVHGQVEELLAQYGQIDLVWFDGPWPNDGDAWRSRRLVARVRELQPGAVINNRLGAGTEGLGDFTTPEHKITAGPGMWESCQVTTWRVWGYHRGERWKTAPQLLDLLCESASKGGNLLLNVGPDGTGRIPEPCRKRLAALGDWLAVHGEAIYAVSPRRLLETVPNGWLTGRGNDVYLILRFWDPVGSLPLAGLASLPRSVELLGSDAKPTARRQGDNVIIENLPAQPPTELFPVLKLSFDAAPVPAPWAVDPLWVKNGRRYAFWAARRGTSVWVDGMER
jgi:alpha-L-fucosidase